MLIGWSSLWEVSMRISELTCELTRGSSGWAAGIEVTSKGPPERDVGKDK